MRTTKVKIEDVEIPVTKHIIPKRKFYIVFTVDAINCEWNEWPCVYASRNMAMRAVEFLKEDECKVIEIELPEIN